MGSYTSSQDFYLIDSSELVNVETDLNYNLRRADERVRPLVEWQWTDVDNITSSNLTKDEGFKWYKARSNSVFYYRSGTVVQDTNSRVDSWSSTGIVYETGYEDWDQGSGKFMYCTGDNWVRWRGRIQATGLVELPITTTVNFVTVPTSILPLTSKYFFVHGGNSGSYQAARIFVPSSSDADKRIEFIKYGNVSNNVTERYLSLNDIYYPLDI